MRPTPRTIRRYLPLVLLAVTAVLAWRSAERADIDDERAEALVYEQELTTPLFSARRVPLSLQAPIAADALQPAIDTLITGSTPDSCLIVTVDERLLWQQNADRALVPASNQKIVTTYAALEVFGPETTFSTEVRTTGTVVDGVLEGSMFLVGGGDPFLGTDDWLAQFDTTDARFHTRLETLADDVAASGIIAVTGGLLGDESMFDSERVGPWAQRLVDTRQSGPLSALSVNENFVSWPAVFEGSFRPRVPAANPPAHAAEVFARLLNERGIEVAPAGAGIAPAEATVVAEIQSPPLADLVTHVNSYSNNFGAEILLKHIGRERRGTGSTVAGAEAAAAVLRENDISTAGTLLTDGSGLGEETVLTCRMLTDILITAGPESVLAQSLSIAGQRGSLAPRHTDSPANGQVYAKTGTLNDVTALSGYVYSPIEEDMDLTFSYIANGELAGQDEALRSLQEPFVDSLASYPSGPTIATLSPTEPIPVLPTPPVSNGSGDD